MSLVWQVMYDELEIGNVIGKGSTGVVLQAIHKPTGIKLALKVGGRRLAPPMRCLHDLCLTGERTCCFLAASVQVISMFEKGKRNQLIREVCTLYNASCPR